MHTCKCASSPWSWLRFLLVSPTTTHKTHQPYLFPSCEVFWPHRGFFIAMKRPVCPAGLGSFFTVLMSDSCVFECFGRWALVDFVGQELLVIQGAESFPRIWGAGVATLHTQASPVFVWCSLPQLGFWTAMSLLLWLQVGLLWGGCTSPTKWNGGQLSAQAERPESFCAVCSMTWFVCLFLTQRVGPSLVNWWISIQQLSFFQVVYTTACIGLLLSETKPYINVIQRAFCHVSTPFYLSRDYISSKRLEIGGLSIFIVYHS